MSNNNTFHFWLRAEVKPDEHRTLLLPSHVKELLAAGHKITVERSTQRCIPDSDYECIDGVTIVEESSWPNAPSDAVIVGLKELPESTEMLTHKHVFFAHCFKEQDGWQDILLKFCRGKGQLWDLEFLVDGNGRRVAAFGICAGFVGMCMGMLTWVQQQMDSSTLLAGGIPPFNSFDDIIAYTKKEMARVTTSKQAKVVVIGALGRCGSGAADAAKKMGVAEENLALWDLPETKKGGPFPELAEFDIVVNCIYLMGPTPPFLTMDILTGKRNLSVLVDVSCDPNNPYNPFPIYDAITTFQEPTLRVIDDAKLPLDIVAIDHLPSLVPIESSMEFATAILPHLSQFESTDVWSRALELFNTKLNLPEVQSRLT